MSVSLIDQQTFPGHIAANDLTIVKFGAPWCGPCKALAPMLDRLSDEFPSLSFIEVNVDNSPHLAAQFNIRGLPTLVALKSGEVQWVKVGLPQANDLRKDFSSLI